MFIFLLASAFNPADFSLTSLSDYPNCAPSFTPASPFARSRSHLDHIYKSTLPSKSELIVQNRIIEIEWAVKNNKEFVPSPKPVRKERKKRGKKASRRDRAIENLTTGLGGDVDENGNDTIMQVDEFGMKITSRGHGHSHKLGGLSGTEFGLEITNTTSNGNLSNLASGSSPRLFKRLFVDVEEGDLDLGDGGDGVEDVRTPVKKPKLADLGSNDDEMASEDEVEVEVWGELPPAPVKEKPVAAS